MKYTIKINLVSEFKVTVYVQPFWMRVFKGEFDIGQVDLNSIH